MICSEKFLNTRILDGQVALMLSAFNIDCDLLIEKYDLVIWTALLSKLKITDCP